MKDVAARANVSIGTVDRVIHNRGEVSEDTKNKILKIIKDLDYRPNVIARSLASKKIYNFSILLPFSNDENEYWHYPHKGIARAIQEIHDYGVHTHLLSFDLNDKDSFTKETKQILDQQPDGILTAPVYYQEVSALLEKCEANNIPYSLIDSNIEQAKKVSYIGQNAFRSGYLVAKLLDFGITNDTTILLISIAKEADNANTIIRREKGFYDYFKEHNGQRKIHYLRITNFSETVINDTMNSIFDKYPNVGGIFVTNSRVHLIADYLKKNKSNHIKLIGYDLINHNLNFLKNGSIDFIISQKPEEQGYRGIMSLFNDVVMKQVIATEQYLPIDIITKENLEDYLNY
ncbi:LacI family DNA-binding transcriptional regulator [Fulvivirgaceae bacterium BMA10]|uniref:LacI family DNA-binding transcriptional regulator n=1 Tax=Splendidivirga corallicola TaxID=3051826 RepID=A0ABT8KY43_9BACT|nr:LacI family DNA-binding transcriptional regulator [Fulvivirgaceae bacterium BMA10]